ncbi:hypothetical protein KIPB_002610 [Kipferlia bialata]|uniref:Helicase ATP-binding domain-containing protein n=1 Tax=Kipferlia bialata TaxID=797122 RepID=A0A9K3CQX2_9EUKA|nr:hypothetical protein KIPB_002610 [Kipferlia bialata]|eukprot:g2610.t1
MAGFNTSGLTRKGAKKPGQRRVVAAGGSASNDRPLQRFGTGIGSVSRPAVAKATGGKRPRSAGSGGGGNVAAAIAALGGLDGPATYGGIHSKSQAKALPRPQGTSVDLLDVEPLPALDGSDPSAEGARGDREAQPAHELTVEHTPVSFPFAPYPIQLDYMGKLISAFKRNELAMLESPTGTGKTLCLLSAANGYRQTFGEALTYLRGVEHLKTVTRQKHFASLMREGGAKQALVKFMMSDKRLMTAVQQGIRGAVMRYDSANRQLEGQNATTHEMHPPVVWYLSRTHKQLENVAVTLQELSKQQMVTNPVVILASRKHVCLSQGCRTKNRAGLSWRVACRQVCEENRCPYNRMGTNYDGIAAQYSKYISTRVRKGQGTHTQAEFVKYANDQKVCPYYLARAVLQTRPSFVLAPFNYLMSPQIRLDADDTLHRSIVLVDEGHNIAGVCKDAMTVEVHMGQLHMCVVELHELSEGIDAQNEANEVKEQHRAALFPEKVGQGKSALNASADTLPEEEPLTVDQVDMVRKMVQALLVVIEPLVGKDIPMPGPDFHTQYVGQIPAQSFMLGVGYLDKAAQDVIKTKKSGQCACDSVADFFRGMLAVTGGWDDMGVMVERQQSTSMRRSADSNDDILKLWCYEPKRGFTRLLEKTPGTVAITSGTLAPIELSAAEFGCKFPQMLSNPHVIKKEQLFACRMPQINGTPLNSSFKSRSDPNYLRAVGALLTTVAQAVPEGVLVFFPSFGLLRSICDSLETNGAMDQIKRVKKVYIDTRSGKEENTALPDYMAHAKDGAMLMSVCRASSSEGVDFRDEACRGVVILGVPFPNARAPIVSASRRYLDNRHLADKRKGVRSLSGAEWYTLEAYRAVNQALGRVIRHKDDYGCCILADERFGGTMPNIAQWIRETVRPVEPASLGMQLTRFFAEQSGGVHSSTAFTGVGATRRQGPGLGMSGMTSGRGGMDSNPKRRPQGGRASSTRSGTKPQGPMDLLLGGVLNAAPGLSDRPSRNRNPSSYETEAELFEEIRRVLPKQRWKLFKLHMMNLGKADETGDMDQFKGCSKLLAMQVFVHPSARPLADRFAHFKLRHQKAAHTIFLQSLR